jgi:hypothetical protein
MPNEFKEKSQMRFEALAGYCRKPETLSKPSVPSLWTVQCTLRNESSTPRLPVPWNQRMTRKRWREERRQHESSAFESFDNRIDRQIRDVSWHAECCAGPHERVAAPNDAQSQCAPQAGHGGHRKERFSDGPAVFARIGH